jgi:hypothetical protein
MMMTPRSEQDGRPFDVEAHLAGMTSLDWADSVRGSTDKTERHATARETGPKAADLQVSPSRTSEQRPAANTPGPADGLKRRLPSAVTLVVLCAAFTAFGFAGAHTFGNPTEVSPAPTAGAGAAGVPQRNHLAALDAEIGNRQKVLADLQRRIDVDTAMLAAPHDSALVPAPTDEQAAQRGDSAPRRAAQIARTREAELSPRDTASDDLPSDNLPSRPRQAFVAPQKATSTSAVPASRVSEGPPAASPPTGTVRVFIHVPIGAPAALARARAIAAELVRDGVAVADIRSVPHAVRRDAVRFFYDADRAALGAVERAVRDASPPGGPTRRRISEATPRRRA